jgi:hypothetical protein
MECTADFRQFLGFSILAPPIQLWCTEEVLGTAEKTRHGEDGR